MDNQEALRRAARAHESGDVAGAEAAYRDAARAGSLPASFQLGIILQSRGAHELAAAAYEPVAATGDVEAALNLAILLAYELERPEDAIALFGAVAEKGDARGWLELGMLNAHLGRFTDAESVLRKALDDEPRAQMALASVLSVMDRHEEALASYRAALAQGVEGAWSGVAWELMRLDHLDSAEDAATRGVAAQDPGAGGVLGVVLRQLGRFEEAAAAFEAAVERGEPAWLPYGDLLAGWEGREDEAEAAYAQAIKHGEADAGTALIKFLLDRGREDDVRKLIADQLALRPDDEHLRRLVESLPPA
ncbi:MAG TPA: tetratricopeptide repeat protein [Solirubrobacteraceae bacterium]|nr:tetratricopeptide repeat protein [Solirubrobacteraceae bacterium]